MEQLREDLIAFVRLANVPQSEALVDAIRQSPANNESMRGDYRDYYDADLRDLVGRSSRWMIDRFGYTF
jgi:hypothetical protein